MKLNEAIYNWLQIKVVAEARPEDRAAQDTYSFFSQILEEDHQVEILDVVLDDTMYVVTFNQDGKKICFVLNGAWLNICWKPFVPNRNTINNLVDAVWNSCFQ